MYFPVAEFKIPQIGLYNHLSYLQYHPNFPLLTDGHSDKKITWGNLQLSFSACEWKQTSIYSIWVQSYQKEFHKSI